jgi:glycosyltransferase involved in cell wall biosynthesis
MIFEEQKSTWLIACHTDADFDDLIGCLESIAGNNKARQSVVLIFDGLVPNSEKVLLSPVCSEIELLSACLLSNQGFAEALNFGCDAIHSDYILRIDPDDRSEIDRACVQTQFMDDHPEVAVCGSACALDLATIKHFPYSVKNFHFALKNPIAHPSVIMRKSAITAVGGYPSFRKCQDFALWCALYARGYALINLPGVHTRIGGSSTINQRRGLDYLVSELIVMNYVFTNCPVLRFSMACRIVVIIPYRILQFAKVAFRSLFQTASL